MDGDGLFVRRGGSGEPVLLLLHGLGATAEVWHGLTEVLGPRWPGSWLAPDLPGHGRSAGLPRYSFGGMAAVVAQAVAPGQRVAVLGHSLGGVLGLALASGWFGVRVAAVCGLGIKVRWSADELTRAAQLAGRPSPVFATAADAAQRWLRIAGLTGLVPPDSALVEPGLAAVDGGWRPALDHAAFGVGAPDMTGLLAACRAPVILAAGEHDPLSAAADLRALVPDPVLLAGRGHNAHVEDPGSVLPVIDRLLGQLR